MMRRTAVILFLFLAVALMTFAIPNAWAKSSPDIETEEESAANDAHSAMLLAGQYDQLDREMNQIQKEYEEGKRDDISLMHFFRAFSDFQLDPALQKNYDGWIKAYPKSYVARQARATYFRRRAGEIFESAKDPDNPKPQEKSEMKRLTDAALADSKAAVGLTAKPILAYDNMIQIGWLTGNRAMSKEILDLANKIDPGNFVPRINYMPVLQTRWGGSMEQLLAFREEVAKALPVEWLVNFDDLIEHEKSWQDWQEKKADYELLKAGQYKQLDERMNRFQKEYEEGKRDDSSLQRLFGIFDQADPDLEHHLQAWVEAYPQSYAARHARTLYFLHLALKARGIRFMKETSQDEVAGMRRYMNMAMEDGNIAVSLTAKPILTYDTILTIAQFSSADELSVRMLEMAKEADPKNYIVRYQYMSTLQGRWGGSLEAMENFLKEIKSVGLSPRQIESFEKMILNEKYWIMKNMTERNETIGQLQTGL